MPRPLTELIDLDVLRELADSLWRSSGLPTRIVTPAGEVLAAAGQQEICTLFHRRHPVTLRECIESDAELTERLLGGDGSSVEALCRNGLMHIGLPIVSSGRHLGTLFLSQFLYEPPDEELFRRRAKDLGLDEKAYLAALRKIPVLDRERVREIIGFFKVLVRLLSEMGSREEFLIESREKLKQSEERFRSVIESTPLGVLLYDLHEDDRLVLAGGNQAADAILGISLAPQIGRRLEEIFPALAGTVVPETFRRVCRGERWHSEEFSYSDRDISGVFEIHAFPTGQGRMASIFSEISGRKRREQALIYRERFESLVAGISTRFMELGPAGLDRGIQITLQEIGEFAGVDRSYLFLFSPEGDRMSNTHEWCAPGVSCERDRLQDLPTGELPWIMPKLLSRETVHIPSVADLPAEAAVEKAHFFDQGIRSLLAVPVLAEGRVAGFIGFDAVGAEKVWDRRDIALLRTVGEVLGSALERRKAVEALDYRARLEHLIATLSTRMVNLESEAVDGAIGTALRDIGTFIGVDRCYLFQFSADGTTMSDTHEWTAPGIPSYMSELQGMKTAEIPWLMERIGRNEVLHVPEVEALGPEAAPEKREWTREEIRSLLCVPVLLEERLLGFIGFDAVRRTKIWPPDTILLMRIVGECFANALERRRRDSQLRESRERIAAILRSIKAGLLGIDSEGRVLLMNRLAEDILGFRLAEAHGRPLDDLPVDPLLRMQAADVLAERPTSEFVEWEIPSPEGKRSIQARTDPVRTAKGGLSGAITLLRDISAEREVDRMKSEFISTAAHELRTPLTAVIGYAELLLENADSGIFSSESQREFLLEIEEKAEALSDIVNDLLDLSRVESGQLVRIHPVPTRPDRLLARVVEDIRRMHPSHRFELLLPELLPEILLDPAKIRQVLENLLGNAVKFSKAGSTVRVEGRTDGESVVICVQDEGVGMTPEQLRHVFDKFYRGDASDTAVGGLGLGMAIAKNIVEAHGGGIRVESTPGGGTRIEFTLPCEGMPAGGQGSGR